MISEKTRKKLSNAAKLSYQKNLNFKNKKFDKICEQCAKHYQSNVWNQLRCLECKTIGFNKICKFCNNKFNSPDRSTVYCNICQSTKSYLKGTHRSPELINRSRNTRLKWVKSSAGKKFYKRLGKENSSRMKKYCSTEIGKAQIKSNAVHQSVVMKKLILDGKFTPNITNTWTHWDAKIVLNNKTIKFRSSWEACFWLCNQNLKYETIRIPHKKTVIITDFVDETDRIIYEIKPKCRYRVEKEKINAIIEWCLKNEFKFIWINEHNILDYIDQTKFHKTNIIQLNKLLKGISSGKNRD